VGDPVEPSAQGPIHPHRSGLADEDEERGLEGVVHVAGVVQHPSAEAENHRPMQVDEGLKRGLIAFVDESPKQLRLAHSGKRAVIEETADGIGDGMENATRHDALDSDSSGRLATVAPPNILHTAQSAAANLDFLGNLIGSWDFLQLSLRCRIMQATFRRELARD
jgi:hypothetical protein